MFKLRWLIPRSTKTYDYNHGGEKWSTSYEVYADKILQYSLDGSTWEDVDCKYFEVPDAEIPNYNWNAAIKNNKTNSLK